MVVLLPAWYPVGGVPSNSRLMSLGFSPSDLCDREMTAEMGLISNPVAPKFSTGVPPVVAA
ncbi:hypothetical protein V9102_09345 [Streptococcus anginosus]|uniref:hypothetical protein n=1 Tax=Streptococcus anginosus TaxID=1328 RepID=UPI002FF0951A